MKKESKWVSSNFAANFGRRTGVGNPDIMAKAHAEMARKQFTPLWEIEKEMLSKIMLCCIFGMLSGHYIAFYPDWEQHIDNMFTLGDKKPE